MKQLGDNEVQMFSFMTCTAGNTEADCTLYTEQFLDQIITAHNNLALYEYRLILFCLFIGLLLGFIVAYLVIYFYKL